MTINALIIVPFSSLMGGISVIKSIEQFANGLVVIGLGIRLYNGFEGFLLILNC